MRVAIKLLMRVAIKPQTALSDADLAYVRRIAPGVASGKAVTPWTDPMGRPLPAPAGRAAPLGGDRAGVRSPRTPDEAPTAGTYSAIVYAWAKRQVVPFTAVEASAAVKRRSGHILANLVRDGWLQSRTYKPAGAATVTQYLHRALSWPALPDGARLVRSRGPEK